jgi:hypothetical protein
MHDCAMFEWSDARTGEVIAAQGDVWSDDAMEAARAAAALHEHNATCEKKPQGEVGCRMAAPWGNQPRSLSNCSWRRKAA